MGRLCKNNKVVALSRNACLVMIASAAEVYPKECMGGLCCLTSNPCRIVAAFPWQNAKRKQLEVISESSWHFAKLLGKNSPWSLCYEYHSHPFKPRERNVFLEPSRQDLLNLDVGGVELIVLVTKKKKVDFYMKCENGVVEAAMGPFRFQIKAFQRLTGQYRKTPLYKTLKIRLFA
jgi:proteasome lid subunit RPN8/RPN11